MMQCELLTPEYSTDGIWNEWRELMTRAPAAQRLFGPDWVRIWSETWGATGRWTGRPSLIVVRDSQRNLQGLLALGRPQIGPFSVYATGGHNVPHRGIVAATGQESAVGSAMGLFMADRNWPLIQIGPVLNSAEADQALIARLQEANIHLQLHDRREEITLQAPDTWEEYRSEMLSSKFARKIGYYERRMQRAGHTTVRHYRQPSADEARTMFAELDTIEASSWMATRDGAIPRFTNQALSDFWTQLTIDWLSPQDCVDCWVMHFDGHPVSFCFTLTNGTTRYVIANNYDNTVRDHRTGSTLYRNMIQDGIERGIRRFEFADGDLHYKSLWGAQIDGSRDTWLAVPNRLLGCAATVATRVKTWIRPQQSNPDDGQDLEVAPHDTATANVGA